MKYSGIFLTAAASTVVSLSVPRQQNDEPVDIVGGDEARIEDFPYIASLTYGPSHSCGASILSDRFLLTAAHCVYDVLPSEMFIRVGSAEANRGTEYPITKAYVNPDTRSDLAIVELGKRLRFGPTVRPIELIDKTPQSGEEAVVAGWGATRSGGPGSHTLRSVLVPIVDYKTCDKNYNNKGTVTDRDICAGFPGGGKDACQGDSGGPLTVNGYLTGAVSRGDGCAWPDKPGVYADTTHPGARRFIQDITGL